MCEGGEFNMVEKKPQRLALPTNIDTKRYEGVQSYSRINLLDIYRDTAQMSKKGRNITSAYAEEVKEMLSKPMQGYLNEGRTITVDYRGGVSITKPYRSEKVEKAAAAD